MPLPRVPGFTLAGEGARRALAGLPQHPPVETSDDHHEGPPRVRGHVPGEADGDRPEGRGVGSERQAVVLGEPRLGFLGWPEGWGGIAPDCGGDLLGLRLWVWAVAAAVATACHFHLSIQGL